MTTKTKTTHFQNMVIVVILVLQQFRNILTNESLSNKKENYFKGKSIIIIFKLSFVYCNGIFLRNPYFHFAEPRGSAEQNLGNTDVHQHITDSSNRAKLNSKETYSGPTINAQNEFTITHAKNSSCKKKCLAYLKPISVDRSVNNGPLR
jgi:hypothetical protein